MNKRLTGILIAVFCLFGLVGISQNRSLKEPAPLYGGTVTEVDR